MSHREQVVAAYTRLLATRQAEGDAVEARDRALIAVHLEDGVSIRQVPPLVRTWLLEAGLTDRQIDGLGVSQGTLEKALLQHRRDRDR